MKPSSLSTVKNVNIDTTKNEIFGIVKTVSQYDGGTLELLQECLDSVHRTRKASLASRQKAYEARCIRRKEHQQALSRLALRSNARGAFDGEIGDEDDNELLEEFSTQFNSEPLPSPAKANGSNSISSKDKDKSPILRGNTQTFNSLNAMSDDINSAKIFEEFKIELQEWWHNPLNQTKRQDEEVRCEYSDYLTDKYMCKKLDPLPPSRTISAVRKEISKIIDTFAGEGYLPSNFSEIVFKIEDDESVGPAGNAATAALLASEIRSKMQTSIAPPNLHAESGGMIDSTGSSNDINSKAKPANVTDKGKKKEMEKARVKAQYEAYMKIKSNSVVKVDMQKQKEYEDLNSDIRSLISSIQSKPALK